MNRKLTTATAGLASLLLVGTLAACSSPDALSGEDSAPDSSETLTIGSANFSENVILAHVYAAALNDAGIDTTVKPNIGSREVFVPALEDGSIDLIPEYSGALMAFLDPSIDEVFASDEVYAALGEVLPDGLTMLEMSPAEDKDTLVVTAETAKKYNLKSIADLQPVAGELVLGGPPETKDRRAGIPGLKSLYDVVFKEFKSVDLGGPLTVGGLKNGDLDVGLMFTTQPAIAENSFVSLEDPNNMSLAENIVPIIRDDKASDAVSDALNSISAELTTEDLVQMNREVEIDKKDPEKVARAFVDGALN